jgi:hypothetical protein
VSRCSPHRVADELSERYADLLTGSYDCVDRVVLNAYYPLGNTPGGFRTWWRRLHGSDEQLDNTHLMRMAGRFARRVRAFGKAEGIPVVDCKNGERKHDLAEEYLAAHTVGPGLFLILVARAPAPVWDVQRNDGGAIRNIAKKVSHVNHYSFHIMDPEWGHLTVKMSGHPPFGAQVILNGHEYTACRGQAAGMGFTKEGNCFTAVADPAGLAQVADTLSQPAAVGRLSRACDRWIYSACLCFALDSDEQARTDFRYAYSVYQVEYSRNLLFASGGRMQDLFDRIAGRAHTRMGVPTLCTLFGARQRPRATRASGPPPLAAAIEKPRYDLTVFKVRFGPVTLKAYTKGEHVLRLEAVVHNTRRLGVGRVLDRLPDIVARLAGMVDRFATALDCADTAFLPDGTLDELPRPGRLGRARLGGVDLNKPRMRAALAAALALTPAPGGFTAAEFTAGVHAVTGWTAAGYTPRQAAYDLRKLRGKGLLDKPGRGRRYHVPPAAARTIAALLTLREHVIAPILAGVRGPHTRRTPAHHSPVDRAYETLRAGMEDLFGHLGITTGAAVA